MNVDEYILKYKPAATSVSTKETKKYVVGFLGSIKGTDHNVLQTMLDVLNKKFPRTFPHTTKFAFVISDNSVTSNVFSRIGTNNFRAYLIYIGADANEISKNSNEILPNVGVEELCDCIVVFNDANAIKRLEQHHPEINVIEVNV